MIDRKILEDIKNQRCILFLGPLMTTVRYKGRETSLTEMVCSQVTETLVANNILTQGIDVQRNPYYVMSKYINYLGGRKQLEDQFVTLNSKFVEGPSFAYNSLSKIPFNTIINFGYDHLMESALYEGGYEFQFEYYDYSGDRKQYLKDSDDPASILDDKKQLVYNLLGSLFEKRSQILTEDDQLEFMRQIAGDRKIPDNVISRIRDDKEGKSYIFLGFNFEEWPFRFLLDLLDVPKKMKTSASPKLRNYNIALMTQEFYEERFGLKFLNASPEEFTRELIEEYNKIIFAHKHGYISYHTSDEEYVNAFLGHLENAGLSKRINFWHKANLEGGELTNKVIGEQIEKATVYIPFINRHFVNDPDLQQEMRSMLARPNAMIFPVISRNCEYQFRFQDLKRKAALMLPKENSWLVTATKPPTDDDYVSMIKKINSKIR